MSLLHFLDQTKPNVAKEELTIIIENFKNINSQKENNKSDIQLPHIDLKQLHKKKVKDKKNTKHLKNTT